MTLTPIEAARAIKEYVSPSVCRRLPRVALVEAICAVCKGACPRAVAEAIAEAA
jgi:hypothetical protein